MASITQTQMDELTEAWNLFDDQKKGFVTKMEFGAVLESLGQEASDADLTKMLSSVGATDQVNFQRE
jgi:Ca2+-binding EF-hand superfamily protein